jgi:hypothetical protein
MSEVYVMEEVADERGVVWARLWRGAMGMKRWISDE